jgi:hypothetical protein
MPNAECRMPKGEGRMANGEKIELSTLEDGGDLDFDEGVFR